MQHIYALHYLPFISEDDVIALFNELAVAEEQRDAHNKTADGDASLVVAITTFTREA